MFKRLILGLLAVSLLAIWTSEVHAWAWPTNRRSVGITVTFGSDADLTPQPGSDPETFTARIFGLPADTGQ